MKPAIILNTKERQALAVLCDIEQGFCTRHGISATGGACPTVTTLVSEILNSRYREETNNDSHRDHRGSSSLAARIRRTVRGSQDGK